MKTKRVYRVSLHYECLDDDDRKEKTFDNMKNAFIYADECNPFDVDELDVCINCEQEECECTEITATA